MNAWVVASFVIFALADFWFGWVMSNAWREYKFSNKYLERHPQ